MNGKRKNGTHKKISSTIEEQKSVVLTCQIHKKQEKERDG